MPDHDTNADRDADFTTHHDHVGPQSPTLVLLVESGGEFQRTVRTNLDLLEQGADVHEPDTISFERAEDLEAVLNARTLELLRTIVEQEPGSIRETARLVGRDHKNVYDELAQLARYGIIKFEQDGRAKRPRFEYEQIRVELPFGDAESDATQVRA
jgi:predicted transcriptional regulator